MAFGYPQIYANGLNNNSQIRRSTDMVYQRGGTYQIVLTGDTYQSSIQLDVDLYADGNKVGRMSVVPFNVSQSGPTYTYKFNVRPYDYLSNYVKAEHFQYVWLNDWQATSEQINLNNQYPNIAQVNFKYGYRFTSGSTVVTEYTGSPTNNINHYTEIPTCASYTGTTASGFTNTGEYFDYVGGQFQFDNNYILQNFDQEVGSTMGTSNTLLTPEANRQLSPMSQFLMDYPTVPEMSETGRFLTNAPRIQYVQDDENYVLYYLYGQTGDRQVMEADMAVIEFFDSSNNRVGYLNEPLNFTGTTYVAPTGYTDTLSVFALPCGPQDVTNLFSAVTFSNIAYYTVQLCATFPLENTSGSVIVRNSTGGVTPVSEVFYFYLKNNCGPENTRLAWLNANGGYDYYTFTRYRQDTKKITRSTFDNRYYATDLSSPDRNIGRTVKTFDTNVDQEIVLESDWLNVQQGKWLQELFLSPQVYEMLPDFISPMDSQTKLYKDLRPLLVLSTEVETLTKKHRKLNKYRITLKSADSYFVNRGF